jgi:hypothetical protein
VETARRASGLRVGFIMRTAVTKGAFPRFDNPLEKFCSGGL